MNKVDRGDLNLVIEVETLNLKSFDSYSSSLSPLLKSTPFLLKKIFKKKCGQSLINTKRKMHGK